MGERVELRGTLLAVSPVFVGDPNQSGPYDRMVVRDRAGAPFIPASTLRGALRSSLDVQLSALGRRATAPRACGAVAQGGGREAGPHRSVACALEGGPCDVCRLFGSRGQAGLVTVWDAPVVRGGASAGEGGERLWSDLRVAVPRHRDLGTARRENRTEWEVVRAGGVFEFRVEIVAHDEIDVGLLGLAIDGLSKGVVALGGGRGRGFGRVEMAVTSARVIDLAALVRGDVVPGDGAASASVDGTREFLAPHLARVRAAALEGAADV